MNNVFSAKSETFAERCATKKILRSWEELYKKTMGLLGPIIHSILAIFPTLF